MCKKKKLQIAKQKREILLAEVRYELCLIFRGFKDYQIQNSLKLW